MKLFVILISVLFVGNVFASEQSPVVSCQLNYVSGIISVDAGTVTLTDGDSGTVKYNGFTMDVTLNRVCNTPGGPCSDAYELGAVIEKNGNSMIMSTNVNLTDSGRKYSSSFRLGNEFAEMNCDVK